MPLIENTASVLIIWGIVGYLLGSIPTGLILAKIMNLGNLREIGSGNIGATNVLRTGNKKAAALTLLFDALKGAIAVILAGKLAGADAAQLAGLMAFIGHCFPVWLNFKGGKGVATTAGALAALTVSGTNLADFPELTQAVFPLLGSVTVFCLVLFMSEFVSLAS